MSLTSKRYRLWEDRGQDNRLVPGVYLVVWSPYGGDPDIGHIEIKPGDKDGDIQFSRGYVFKHSLYEVLDLSDPWKDIFKELK